MDKKWKWDDVVEADNIDIEGKSLSDVILKYADEFEQHRMSNIGDGCYCDFCEVFFPMARKLEKRIEELEAVVDDSENNTLYTSEFHE